jgi:putative hydrolase of HD superfamily
MSNLYKFIRAAEKLKTELRHSYSSQGRRESVAEHSWRLCLMVEVLAEETKGLFLDKCLKMALIHDLPEIIAGDSYQLDLIKNAGKYEREKTAISYLTGLLVENTSGEIMDLWLEFEEGKTPESRFVRLLDRLEVLIQHNEADISTWTKEEKQLHYGLAAMHAERWGFLRDFATEIDEETKEKLLKAGIEPYKVTNEQYRKYYP